MRRISCVLPLIVIGVFWSVAVVGGEDMQAVMDAFLVRESAKIELAGNNLEERTEKGLRAMYHNATERYLKTVTPLHIAAQDGELEKVQALLDSGAEVDAEMMEEGWVPLLAAITFNRLDVMECLLENGANPDGGHGTSSLWEAVSVLKLPAVRLLLKYGADPNRTNSVGSTPIGMLFYQVWLVPPQRMTEGLRMLLDAGCDPNKGSFGSPLELAMIAGYTDAEELLRKHGAEPRTVGRKTPEPSKLHIAARSGDLATVKRLVESGSDLNLPDDYSGLSPAYYAAKAGRLDVFEWLVEHGADLGRQAKGARRDILLSAAMGDNLDIVRICLKHGNPVDYQTCLGTSPLGLVVTGFLNNRTWDTAAFLIENGADVNWRDENGTTPLHLMASAWLWEFDKIGMEKMIAAGADPEALDNDGLSPIHYAAARDNQRAMAVLLGKK